ncbi:MAG: hypothetical protein ACLT5H_05975 [Collinsella stercoris]|uniref:hypothetical protein n=1 Tax=Collinsella stercoris TaxID=147206 RepID=UPI0039951DA2
MPKKKAPSERAYARLARRERQAIERMPDRGEGVPRDRPGDRPRAVDAELSGARRGIDETEATAAAEIAAIRDGPRRGLPPGQIAAARPELGLAASTTCRRVDAGHDGMTNMGLRRKVGYGPRRESAPAGAGRRSAFEALPGDAFGVELLEPAELDLTPGRVERARADRGEAPLAE